MKLVIHELVTSLYQEITVGDQPIRLHAVRPHLYMHASPAGSLKVQVRDLNGKTVAESETLSITDVLAGLGTYPHGYQRFLLTAHLRAQTAYRIALVAAGGYSFAEAAYIGWANAYDLGKVSSTYTPSTGLSAALDLELWEYRDFQRRAG